MLAAIPTTIGAGLVNLGLNATGAQSNLGMNDILGGTAGVILNPNTERDFVEFPVHYACVITQQK